MADCSDSLLAEMFKALRKMTTGLHI